MKKVLFLSPLPPPNYGSAMSSKMCLEILQGSKKIEVRNIKLNFASKMSNIGKLNLSKVKGVISISKKIKQEIKEFKPDIIYFVPATYGLGLLREVYYINLIKKKTIQKIIFHIRSRITAKHWKKPLNRILYKKMFKGQSAIILDDSLKSDLHNLIKDKNISVLPNAIKNEMSEECVKQIIQKRKKQNSFNILFLSNMDETKGWYKLLKACKILKEEGVNFNCNFVGAWPNKKEQNKFNNFISQNNLNKEVKYLGRKTGKGKEEIFRISDILVYPTMLDTFGRVIIEAMMFGLPIIANGIAAIPTTIQHNKTGFILKENSPKEIAEYIKKLKDNKLREKMGSAGRKRFLQEYESENYKKKFEKILIS